LAGAFFRYPGCGIPGKAAPIIIAGIGANPVAVPVKLKQPVGIHSVLLE